MRAICDLIQYPTDNDDVTIARLLVTSHGRYVTRDRTVQMSRLIMAATQHCVVRYAPIGSSSHSSLANFHQSFTTLRSCFNLYNLFLSSVGTECPARLLDLPCTVC